MVSHLKCYLIVELRSISVVSDQTFLHDRSHQKALATEDLTAAQPPSVAGGGTLHINGQPEVPKATSTIKLP